MSKSIDMLGSVVRASVGVPRDRLETFAKMASKFSVEHPKDRPEGKVWHAYFKKLTEEGLPDWAYLLDVRATETVLGEFDVNYDETVEQKLQKDAARSLIRSGEFLSESGRLSGSTFKQAVRSGVVRYKATSVSFDTFLTRKSIEEWGRQNKKINAGVKESVDMVLSIPLLKLAPVLPLAVFGECRYDSQEYSYAPSFFEAGDRFTLGFQQFDEGMPSSLWGVNWKFLFLVEVQSQSHVSS